MTLYLVHAGVGRYHATDVIDVEPSEQLESWKLAGLVTLHEIPEDTPAPERPHVEQTAPEIERPADDADLDEWQFYALALGVAVADDASREDIIAAIDATD